MRESTFTHTRNPYLSTRGTSTAEVNIPTRPDPTRLESNRNPSPNEEALPGGDHLRDEQAAPRRALFLRRLRPQAPVRRSGGGGDYGAQGYSEERSSARRVADHYSARSNQTLEERENSPIIHLKKLNNWIKSVLVQLYARPVDCVLDLACGKGGDLIKWDKAKVGYYVGVDIAEGSIKDCMTRYNGVMDQQRRKFSFPARLICADCYETCLDEYLSEDAPFDICSCQFAMHYSWSTEACARQALANISALLRPGGTFIGTMPDANVIIKRLRETEGLEFGNSVYWITFGEEYTEKTFWYQVQVSFRGCC